MAARNETGPSNVTGELFFSINGQIFQKTCEVRIKQNAQVSDQVLPKRGLPANHVESPNKEA